MNISFSSSRNGSTIRANGAAAQALFDALTKPLKPSIFVFGPKACGKTRNAQAIMKALGLTKVIDDSGVVRTKPFPKFDTLILTEEPGPQGVKSMPFEEAMALVAAKGGAA